MSVLPEPILGDVIGRVVVGFDAGRGRLQRAIRGHRILAVFLAFEFTLFAGGWLLDALTGSVDNQVLTNEIFPVLSGILGAAGIAFGAIELVIYAGWLAYNTVGSAKSVGDQEATSP